ncbi:MAG TPA: D-cysteine desulfhydrase family protein [Candidatus Bathyarchaeota archaeon]|nr:D-cysteine desulfhydrase family protein [Candidatus Bathyarchaeota archaeon]
MHKSSILEKMRTNKVCFEGFPTPLQKMPNLSKALGGPNLFIKRDDMTDLAFGGNKSRKLEFSFADAQKKGADIIISTGAIQSNCACMVATAARRLGMKPVLVLVGKEPKVYDGNLLLDKILSSEIHFLKNYGPHVEEYMNNLAEKFRSEGYTPYVIPVGASLPSTVPGYALALQEAVNQFEDLGIPLDYIVCTCGTGGTQAGLIFGKKLLDVQTKIIGATVFASKKDATKTILQFVNGAAKLFDAKVSATVDDVTVFDDYIKEGYGKINSEVTRSLKLVAETEGIFIDPIYTGKAMVMLIDLINKSYFKKTDNVLFFHTGGLPAIFLYKNELQKA